MPLTAGCPHRTHSPCFLRSARTRTVISVARSRQAAQDFRPGTGIAPHRHVSVIPSAKASSYPARHPARHSRDSSPWYGQSSGCFRARPAAWPNAKRPHTVASSLSVVGEQETTSNPSSHLCSGTARQVGHHRKGPASGNHHLGQMALFVSALAYAPNPLHQLGRISRDPLWFLKCPARLMRRLCLSLGRFMAATWAMAWRKFLTHPDNGWSALALPRTSRTSGSRVQISACRHSGPRMAPIRGGIA